LEEIGTQMKTKMRLVALFAGAAIFAAACGGTTATPAPSTPAATVAPATAAPQSMAPESTAPESMAPTAEPLSGEITLWHSYGSGGGETGAFMKALGQITAANKDLKVHVVEQPFADIFNGWNTDVAAGGGPDMFIAPNDSLFSQADAGVLADLTAALDGKLAGWSQVSIDGSKVVVAGTPKMFMVPESLKAVALWYDKSKVATPPATTDALLAGVKDKSILLGIHQDSIYFNYGWAGAFGGKLMDDTGKCIADQGGWADGFKYLADLKAAGAKFYTDGNVLKQDFQSGKINVTIDGPWQTADFVKSLAANAAVANMPGATGTANPLVGVDGWYLNPNSKNLELATKLALQLVATASEQIMTNDAGHVPAAPGVTISSATVQGFADQASAGFPRPQNKQFGSFWGPFGDAMNKVLDKKADPTKAVAEACKLMNDANGFK
jgi:arabinogalactan oligomer/maltooligosaccharide transport system substrate-binding protein